ncbi:hypothetical protein ASD21_03560 [Caulobacter sp. Root1455]|uniref:hypothetical protein n=1 Tax=Caulobacter sp. Root1455 TaxID=1736465 RepID=UPI0006F69901|nr:hypothetical protein [Caulobacter sp. Root1455]KQY99047.1 hypothetical protein ASD21_03560 [Caulobacter sp. Root1455]
MKTKIAMFAAAATLSLTGAAFAQSTAPAAKPTQTPATTSSTTTTTTAPAQTMPSTAAPATTPAAPTSALPGAPTQSTTSSTTSTTSTAADADAAGTPSSANVALDLKVGSEVKDPSGAVVGTIAGTTTGADGSTNVVVTSGEKKFALPKASFSAATTGGLQTTATKAQIDATLAGAKPQ